MKHTHDLGGAVEAALVDSDGVRPRRRRDVVPVLVVREAEPDDERLITG